MSKLFTITNLLRLISVMLLIGSILWWQDKNNPIYEPLLAILGALGTLIASLFTDSTRNLRATRVRGKQGIEIENEGGGDLVAKDIESTEGNITIKNK